MNRDAVGGEVVAVVLTKEVVDRVGLREYQWRRWQCFHDQLQAVGLLDDIEVQGSIAESVELLAGRKLPGVGPKRQEVKRLSHGRREAVDQADLQCAA